MASDERNFRSAYYEKVGFRSVEEKKSLEILLKDKPLDKVKLRQFCLRFSVPGTYRNLLWKLLLDIVPIYIDSHKFVMLQRQQEYKDLLQALQVMRIVDNNMPKPQLFLAMWLVETGKLKYDTNLQIENGFTLISQSLLQMFEDDTDVYWLAKGFYGIVQQFRPDIPKLVERTKQLLEKEDLSLYKHLCDIGVLNKLPLNDWFECCFAGIINDTALGKLVTLFKEHMPEWFDEKNHTENSTRIWDKLCGGSNKMLVFVAVVLLTTIRHKLLKFNDYNSVIQCINTITEETAEVISNKAIELWQQHGSVLTMQDSTHLTKNKSIV